VKLVPRSSDGLKAELPQHLLHRDLGTQPVKVDAWHGFSSLMGFVWWKEDRSVPFLL